MIHFDTSAHLRIDALRCASGRVQHPAFGHRAASKLWGGGRGRIGLPRGYFPINFGAGGRLVLINFWVMSGHSAGKAKCSVVVSDACFVGFENSIFCISKTPSGHQVVGLIFLRFMAPTVSRADDIFSTLRPTFVISRRLRGDPPANTFLRPKDRVIL